MKKIKKIKKEEIEIKDAKIVGGDFFEEYGKEIATNPKKLKKFIKGVNDAYKQTKDIGILFTALKILSYAKGNIKKQSKQANVTRRTTYNMFKPNSNPTFKNVVNYMDVLGVHLQLSI